MNYTLRNIVDSKNFDDALVKRVDKRLADIAGSREQMAAALKAREVQRAAEISLAGDFSPDFELKNLPMPACLALADGATPPTITTWMITADAVGKAEITRILAEMRKKCVVALNDDAVFAPLGGQLKATWLQYQFDVQQLAASRKAAADLQGPYVKALEDYNDAIKAAKSDPAAVKAVQDAAERLERAFKGLDQAQDALSVSFLSDERLKSIEKLIVAITKTPAGGKLPEDVGQATVAFILIPRLIDDARQSLADARKPLAAPLLMRRNHEQLNLEAANRDIASREAMVRLSRELVDALYQQAVQIYMAQRELREPSILQYYNLPVLEAFAKPPAKDRELIYSAAARYLDVLNRLDAKRYKLEYMRIAAMHERSLAYAEVNARQWQSLVGITVDQVADFSAGGIEAESVNSIISTLTLLGIAFGVNK